MAQRATRERRRPWWSRASLWEGAGRGLALAGHAPPRGLPGCDAERRELLSSTMVADKPDLTHSPASPGSVLPTLAL